MLKPLGPLLFCLCILFSAANAQAQLVINEILADNETGLQDDDRERSDWIEIHNPTAAAISLAGWSLTDDPANLSRWKFPATNIAANGFVVVFASDKNRAVAGRQLHTNFKLSADGEYLALVKPDGQTISFEMAPKFPPQIPNVSYGLAAGSQTTLRFFSPPTPNQANSAGQGNISLPPLFSRNGGPATDASITVTLTAQEPDVVIRYTINGADPTATSTAYSSPITISSTTVIRAKAFGLGKVPSETVTRTFTMIGTDLANFSSNLPVLVLSTFSATPNQDAAIRVSAMLIGTNGTRAYLNGKPDFDGRGTLKVRGSSSAGFPKNSFAFELQDDLGLDQDVSLLGLPEDSDWVLYAPYTDKTLMRDFLAYEWSNAIGTYAPRTRFVEVYLDTSGGKLTQQDYYGVYMLTEKIKRGVDRVNIQELHPSQNTQPEVTGGYIWKKDRLDPGDSGFGTANAGSFAYVEPKEQEITSQQRTYLNSYLSQFETALYGASFPASKNYMNFYNVAAGIDHHWIVEACRNIDGFRLSTFVSKDRLGKITMGPVWDYNLSLGNADYLDGYQTAGWYNSTVGDGEYPWYRRLFTDPDFNQAYIDRWGEIRGGPFATTNILGRVIEIANVLGESAARNFVKWPVLGIYVWPNAPGYESRTTYRSEVNWMTNWINGRFNWIDSQFLKSPPLNQAGGVVAAGTQVTISGSLPIYYTTDGSDPRSSGGATAGNALRYTQPITINQNSRLVARVKNGNVWSPPSSATYIVSAPQVVVTEIMFNPDADVSRDYEFIELKNVGATAVDLKGFKFTTGIDFTFANSTVVQQGGLVVLVKNQAAFTTRYDTVNNVVGQYTGTLDNAGERIVLQGSMKEPVLDFSYNNAWYPATDGYGFSLVIRDAQAPLSTWDSKESWRVSAALGGSPGQDDPEISRPTVLISEVLTHTDPPDLDSIELFNPGPNEVDVSHWFLSDDPGAARKFKIPAPTKIAPNSYVVFTEADFNSDPLSSTSFALSSTGDEVYLFSADSAGNLTGVSDGVAYGAAANGVSFGRYVTGDGKTHHVAQKSRTLGSVNSGPVIGPVVINEIRYSPASYQPEFIELKNISSAPVNLFDPANPANTWQINGIEFTFPPNVTLGAGALLVVAQNDPGRFRLGNNVPVSVAVYGPFAGNLQENGEMIQLLRPDSPNGPGSVPMIVVDEVRYNDKSPWPTGLFGLNESLERIYTDQFGNDPANWRASVGGASPGLDNDGNRPPVVRAGDDQAHIVPRFPFRLNVSATALDDGLPAPATLSLQWRQVSGPGTATFDNTSAAATSIVLPAPGEYVFSISANDGALETTSALTITAERPSSDAELIAFGATWDYLDDGSNQGTAWTENNFVPNGWKSGRGQFGYGDNDEVTQISYGPDAANKFVTTYFRKTFNVANPAMVTALTARFVRDDGVVVHLNGQEAFREGMQEGIQILYNTYANFTAAGADESAILQRPIGLSLLRAGVNVIAVELHQVVRDSTDVSFDLQLTAAMSQQDEFDGWRTQMFSSAELSDPLVSGPTADPDGDGQSNYDEYVCGTNPKSSSSALQLSFVTTGPLALQFEAASDRSYTVYFRNSLNQDVWTATGSYPAGVARTIRIDSPQPGFYRVAVP